MSRIFFLALILLFGGQNMALANELGMLKYMLKAREQEPRMYLPDVSSIGNPINILVLAPGAKKIVLYGSNQEGENSIAGQLLRLGTDFRVLGEVKTEKDARAEFQIPLDPVKDIELADKFYAFEALVTYENPENGQEVVRRASFFGANASFSNNNVVKILPISKDHSGMANMARSMIPGLGMNQQGNYR